MLSLTLKLNMLFLKTDFLSSFPPLTLSALPYHFLNYPSSYQYLKLVGMSMFGCKST